MLHPDLTADHDANPAAPGAPAVVLVVDDEPAVRGVVVRTLQRRGYETAEAPDAETALSILGSQPGRFRVVITDDRMPGMSGYELVAVIARIHPHIRIVLMSGFAGAGDPATAGGGLVRVLPKPFNATGLLSAVTDVLREDQ